MKELLPIIDFTPVTDSESKLHLRNEVASYNFGRYYYQLWRTPWFFAEIMWYDFHTLSLGEFDEMYNNKYYFTDTVSSSFTEIHIEKWNKLLYECRVAKYRLQVFNNKRIIDAMYGRFSTS